MFNSRHSTSHNIKDKYFKYSSKKTEKVVRMLINEGHTPKEFMNTLVNCSEKIISDHRKLLNVGRGLPSTMDLVTGIRGILLETQGGREAWRHFVLDEVSSGVPVVKSY